MQVACGNLGGVLSSFLFLTKDSPHFYPGHGTLIAILSMSTAACIGMRWYLARENQKLEQRKERGENVGSFVYTI